MAEMAKILVVEDNDFVRMQIVGFLKGAGYETLEATEGQAALETVLGNEGIDLAIVDVRMEPVGGFEFVKALRGREIKTPIILATGDQTPDLLEQAQKWGVGAVLMKPVEKERLLKTVERTVLGIKRGKKV
ncbi:MAG: response regulator [Rhodospirillales bacterium]|nr:response regulator [Rhodospirillales bacterium]